MTGTKRRALVEYDDKRLRDRLHWTVRTWGQGVGGYAAATGKIASWNDSQERAEATAQVWIERGIYPAHQTDADRAAVMMRRAA
ncbi:hypothetical protein [Sphingomonas xinjiangensis]|uniref:Uncharacterized protein n=1 Tax=Sphingomonas xinjiangensis TaxID=643568 RepID=A0A840YK50_9SPHN|nr:hypothetical protein [Sphingomonas xinjiangensis]MBB5709300.1 hypothetical protein [Sphingomonas xinjiangensis]